MHPIIAGIEVGGRISPIPYYICGCICFFMFVTYLTMGLILLRRLIAKFRTR